MNIDQIRNETPNCRDKIFLNSAGASLMPKPVIDSVINYLKEEEKIGGYKLEELWEEELDGFYNEVAKLINAESRNIAFANNATDAYTKALSSIKFEKGDVVIISDDDYVSNYMHFITLKKRHGITIRRIDNLENGELDIQHFKTLVDIHKPKLVSISHIPTGSGLIQNVHAIGEICSDENIIYLVDACQSIGQINVDVEKIKCDFLSATGRKFLRGPRGSGFLFVSDRLLSEEYSPLYVDLGGADWTKMYEYQPFSNARRFEFWEKPCALMIGVREAAKYATNIGLKNIEDYNDNLIRTLRRNLAAIPKVNIFDRGLNPGNIVTWRKTGKNLSLTKSHLDKHDVFYSIVDKGSALIDFDKKGIEWVVRFSPHYFNTLSDITKASEIVESL